MKIVNRTEREVTYELRGGPERMILSTCDLSPGEQETWTSPYRVMGMQISCEVFVRVEGVEQMISGGERDTVEVVSDAAAACGWSLRCLPGF